ncbi:hypothetical protein QCE62_19655 [Caballeronia sp. LZ033]|uniref:hypothetical protein n=1 Tax=Caballeronia sp. LZ033 TaxID=3038566 RepID=UPI00285EBA04|nr:hypothetical protein [Caballeronia sp. LZ033]MDR5815806.1 hypothetical protein [Caballeronia sp. LZ033]
MTDEQIEKKFEAITAELDFLRARCDVLSLALKYKIRTEHNAEPLLSLILQKIDETSQLGLFSDAVSDAYLGAYRAAGETIARWRESLPPVDE